MRSKNGCRCSLDEQQTCSGAPRTAICTGAAQGKGAIIAEPAYGDSGVRIHTETVGSIAISQIKRNTSNIRGYVITITARTKPNATAAAASDVVTASREI
jgi:hypothetical protein